jgi:hypothetical protein
MSAEATNKKVRPRTPEELVELEDRLRGLEDKIREIRREMKDSGMETVTLGLGTFQHYLSMLEPLAEEFLGKCRAQRATLSAIATRERIKAEMAKKNEKK